MKRKKGRYITTKYDGICWECHAKILPGTKVLWYGNGEMYGLDCHENALEKAKQKEIPPNILNRLERIFAAPDLYSDEPLDLYTETGIRFQLDDMD